MKLKLKDILPNPYRDLKANPLIEEKIVSLMDSINQTGFWDNVVVRKNAQGKYELAYGHHRLAAAIRAGLTEADFIVKELDDALMIQIMDNENRETYGSTPASLIESVKAVVQALAKGTIPPFKIDPKINKQHLRYAPSFVPGVSSTDSVEHAYTTLTIATFLGRTRAGGKIVDESITAALNALYLKEVGRFSDSLLITKDRTGAKKPITTNELLRITSDIKRTVEREDKTKAAIRKVEQEAVEAQRKLEAERKGREKKLEAQRQESLKKEAEARIEENKREIARQKQRQADLAEREKEKEVIDNIKMAAIEAKVADAKKKAEEKQKESEYASIKREVEALVALIEAEPTFSERAKALSRKTLSSEDRERLRQVATTRGTWYSYTLANLFLPPLTTKQYLGEQRKREAAKQRAAEAEAEKTTTKKGTKKKR